MVSDLPRRERFALYECYIAVTVSNVAAVTADDITANSTC